MYSTIEADIRKGRIVPLEPDRVPNSGHALIVLLKGPVKRASWRKVRSTLGWLKLGTDPEQWQRAARSEWEKRP